MLALKPTFRRLPAPGAPMGIFRIEAIGVEPSYHTICEATALNSRAALALYREWLSVPGVECIQVTRPILHARWSKWTIAGQVAPLQFGYNEVHLVAHWKVVKGFYSPLYRRKYPFAKDW